MKAETEKASKQQLHFSPILFVFRHPAPDGGHSISNGQFFQIHGSKFKLHQFVTWAKPLYCV